MFNNYLRSPKKKCLTIHFLKTAVKSNLNNKKRNRFLLNYYSILLHSIMHKVTPDSWTKREENLTYWRPLYTYFYENGLEIQTTLSHSDVRRTFTSPYQAPSLFSIDDVTPFVHIPSNPSHPSFIMWSGLDLFSATHGLTPWCDSEIGSASASLFDGFLLGEDSSTITNFKITLGDGNLFQNKDPETPRPLTNDIMEIIKRIREEEEKKNPNKGGGSGGGSNGGLPSFPPMGPTIEERDRPIPRVPDIHALSLKISKPLIFFKKLPLLKGALFSDLDIFTYKLQLSWEEARPSLKLLRALILRGSKALTKAENLPNPRLIDNSLYIKLRHLGFPSNIDARIWTLGLDSYPLIDLASTHMFDPNNLFKSRPLYSHLPTSGANSLDTIAEAKLAPSFAFMNLKWTLTLLDPSINLNVEENLTLPTITQFAPDWIERNDRPTKDKFTFFNRFWLYCAPGLNDLVFKFFNSRFKYFMFLMARYEKAFRIHFHIQTITRLNQYFLSFFLTKNITFKNHKKIINSNIIVAYIKPNKRIYTSLKFLKLFLTFKKREFFSSKVYFLIKFALFSERSFVNSYVSKLYSAFNKNLSNKVIKSPEAGQTIKIEENTFSAFLEERRAEPITEAVAAALALRKEYIQKVRKLKRERIQMKLLRKN